MQSVKQFAAKNKIRLTCEPVDRNPNAANDDWAKTANHYKCRLSYGRRSMTVYYSMGSALTHEPRVEDVLDSLAMEWSDVENSPKFEDWAREYGYDLDSRRAERIYKVVIVQSRKFEALLGRDILKKLAYETERL
jgi:hypothetical protein